MHTNHERNERWICRARPKSGATLSNTMNPQKAECTVLVANAKFKNRMKAQWLRTNLLTMLLIASGEKWYQGWQHTGERSQLCQSKRSKRLQMAKYRSTGTSVEAPAIGHLVRIVMIRGLRIADNVSKLKRKKKLWTSLRWHNANMH